MCSSGNLSGSCRALGPRQRWRFGDRRPDRAPVLRAGQQGRLRRHRPRRQRGAGRRAGRRGLAGAAVPALRPARHRGAARRVAQAAARPTARSRCWSTTPPATIAIRSTRVTPEYWDERFAVNLKHQFFAAQAVLPDDEAGRRRLDHQHGLDLVDGRPGRHGGLHRGQVGGARPHPLARPRLGPGQHPGQLDRAGLDHDRAAEDACG